jgi:hypothetical protein
MASMEREKTPEGTIPRRRRGRGSDGWKDKTR